MCGIKSSKVKSQNSFGNSVQLQIPKIQLKNINFFQCTVTPEWPTAASDLSSQQQQHQQQQQQEQQRVCFKQQFWL